MARNPHTFTILKYHHHVWLDLDSFADLILMIGIISSVCACTHILHNKVCLAISWYLYLSLFNCGQTFLSFQWDILLLETGFLAILWAPWLPHFPAKCDEYTPIPPSGQERRDSQESQEYLTSQERYESHAPSPVVLWLIRFTFFKLMFMAGIVKMQANCETWVGLTALDYHYATQPLPTPLAWSDSLPL